VLAGQCVMVSAPHVGLAKEVVVVPAETLSKLSWEFDLGEKHAPAETLSKLSWEFDLGEKHAP
jgi:hypothetical protein